MLRNVYFKIHANRKKIVASYLNLINLWARVL